MNVYERAVNNLTPYKALTGAGVGLTAYAFLANLGAAHFGVVPLAVQATARQQVRLPIDLAVRQWAWFFGRAAPTFIVSIVGGAASYYTASVYVPQSHPDRKALVRWLRILSALAFAPLPYTVGAMLPTNKALQQLASSTAQFSAQNASQAQTLLEKWTSLNAIRMGIFGVTFIAGVIPLLAA
jgi:hypothetical protein